jgi:hypothetical protein
MPFFPADQLKQEIFQGDLLSAEPVHAMEHNCSRWCAGNASQAIFFMLLSRVRHQKQQ